MSNLNKIFSSCKKDMEKIFDQLKSEIYCIRLGSKSVSSLLGEMNVKYNNTSSLLLEVSNIHVLDHRNISIRPWDRNILPYIEKSIINANLGFTPTHKGNTIHIHLPVITEERRRFFIKKIKSQTEHAKILIRETRKKNKKNIKKIKVSEDISKNGEKYIQKITIEYIDKINDFFSKKEKEILKI
ncbi:ribosome-recycling factor [Blattabacterium cuenoti]